MTKYKWENTPQITQLLIEIEALGILFSGLQKSPHIEESFLRNSLLKSGVFSARIEGIPSTLSSPKLEGQNLVRAYKLIRSGKIPKKLTIRFIFLLHKMALKNLSFSAGHLRKEPWAVFNEGGVAIHMAPAHFNLPKLMSDYVNYINTLKEPSPVKAAVAQFIFEKIHPFADGNGRVGRLISGCILEKDGYGFKGLVPLEEYIEKERGLYYDALLPGTRITQFIEFFLEAFVSQAKEVFDKISNQKLDLPESRLLPRRQEILEIIRIHPYCSFDFIRRRFQAVNPKTLHYDLQQLQKSGLIEKAGVSRGAVYKSCKLAASGT